MDRRQRIERWFARRGVPQLIEGYTSEQRMDARALPFLGAWVALAIAVITRRPSLPPTEELVVVLISLAAVSAVLAAFLFLRRHPPFGGGRLDLIDVLMLGLVPGIAAALVQGNPFAVIGAGGFVLAGVGVIYLVTGFGLIELAGWGLRYLREQLGQIAWLVSRTLPILLILVVFLLFASELWQAAHTLGGADLAAVLALLLAVATVLVVTRARVEIGDIEAARDPEAIERRLAGTPAEGLAQFVETTKMRPLSWRERLNLVLLMLVSQLIQSLFVAVLVAIFLVALGLLAIPASVQEMWVGQPVRELFGFELLGEPRLVSVELLITAGLLGGVSALYFTGLALTDATYRAEFHEHVVTDIEQIVAVHTAYLASPELQAQAAEEAAASVEASVARR
jgi:hypothetical protein